MSRPLTLRWRGRPIEGTLELGPAGAALTRDGRRFEARVRRDGPWIEVHGAGTSVRCAAVADGRGVWIAHEGRTWRLERVHREAAEHSGAESVDEVRAPMTGRVASVAARAGQALVEGDLLLTIEAMKMEFRLTAPEDGTVVDVLCSEGDKVELGALLVRLEPARKEGGPGAQAP